MKTCIVAIVILTALSASERVFAASSTSFSIPTSVLGGGGLLRLR